MWHVIFSLVNDTFPINGNKKMQNYLESCHRFCVFTRSRKRKVKNLESLGKTSVCPKIGIRWNYRNVNMRRHDHVITNNAPSLNSLRSERWLAVSNDCLYKEYQSSVGFEGFWLLRTIFNLDILSFCWKVPFWKVRHDKCKDCWFGC